MFKHDKPMKNQDGFTRNIMNLTTRASVRALPAACLAGLIALSSPTAMAKDSAPLELARQLNRAFIEVAESVTPAVVVIRVAHKEDYVDPDEEGGGFQEMVPPQLRKWFEEQFKEQFKDRREAPRKDGRKSRHPDVFDGQGSGVVIREDGYILTNRHVVDGASKIKVKFKDGTEYDGEIKGVDSYSDIAVIKIEGKNLPTAKLADSNKTKVGEFAIAIGAPFSLDYSITYGHVSAKGRSGVIPLYMGGGAMDQDFIQTDASINPGNSGGPLVNIEGEVIGINTLIRGMNTGIGFAVPSSLAKQVSDKLIESGRFARSWLGIGIRALSDHPTYKDLVDDVKSGVVVETISGDGPSSKSDLRAGDIITTVDSRAVATAQELKNEVRSKNIGASVTLDVVRLDAKLTPKRMKIKVKTGEAPEDTMPVSFNRRPAAAAEETSKDLGVTVKSLTKDLAKEYGVEQTDGVIVTDVERGSIAAENGIRPGAIITEVNRKPVTSPKEFREALKGASPKKGIVLNLTSEGGSQFRILKDTSE